MAAFNNLVHGFDLSILEPMDHQLINLQIEQQARANSSNEMNYQCLVNDPKYQRTIVQNYINTKKTIMSRGIHQSHVFPHRQVGAESNNTAHNRNPIETLHHSCNGQETEGAMRDRIAREYGVLMSQFQTSFKDNTYDNLKSDASHSRHNTYHPKIGCLGMKSFEFNKIPQQQMFEAMYLYIVDDIEEKQRTARNRAGFNFLERIGMDADLSSYYHAHRKSNHGGASSALYSFNESESFSFRRNCMKAGLKTDMAAMDEADARKAKNHPYQRTFYGDPKSQKDNCSKHEE